MPTSTRFDPIAPLASLAGVGPARAARLARLGIECVRDLLLVQPRVDGGLTVAVDFTQGQRMSR